MQKRT